MATTSMRKHWPKVTTAAFPSCIVASVLISAGLAGPLAAYDFSALTALANGALQGENVDQPVPGFEIRLLQDGQAIFYEAF